MRMIHGSRILQIALIISLSVSLSSCGVGRTLDILESAIEELGAQPAKWEETLKGAIDEFGWVTIGVVHQVRQEIESLMRQTIQTAQEASFCEADFIGIRVKQLMQGILYKYFPEKSNPRIYTPVICTIDPIVVQSDSTYFVNYSGFDFLTFRNTDTS